MTGLAIYSSTLSSYSVQPARKGQHSQDENLAVGCGLDNCLAGLLLCTGPSTSWQYSHLSQSRHCSL